MTSELNLSNLRPAEPRKARKRVGRGMGSGKGRYAGRGIKGLKSRSGSHKMRAGFEGGQTPLYMRLGKLPGATSKDAMPIGPFRTRTQGVNVSELERVFDAGADVTPEALKAARLVRSLRVDVKVLGNGELTKPLTVTVHSVSATAREKIEAAGGSVQLLREPTRKKRRRGRTKTRSAEAETPAADDGDAKAEAAAPEPEPEPAGAEPEPEPEQE